MAEYTTDRVTKKISTPFLQSQPDAAIIMVNAVDPQINTTNAFVNSCRQEGIDFLVVLNKIDKISKERLSILTAELKAELKVNYIMETVLKNATKDYLVLEQINSFIYKSTKKGRVIILGTFNTGKTTLFNLLCNSDMPVGDIPGTTLEFTEGKLASNRVYPLDVIIIDSIGQLIDINKPMMVSIDLDGCETIEEKVKKCFSEEILGLTDTLESAMPDIIDAVNALARVINNGKKIIVTGAGASALVAKEMAGQGMECGFPYLVFTNDLGDASPVSFSKGLGEEEGALARYISHCINEGDAVIGISASGGTGFVYETLRLACIRNAVTFCITENVDTPLGYLSQFTIKSDAKPEGPSSSKIQTAHLVIAHTINIILANMFGVTADESIKNMLPERIKTKKMGIK